MFSVGQPPSEIWTSVLSYFSPSPHLRSPQLPLITDWGIIEQRWASPRGGNTRGCWWSQKPAQESPLASEPKEMLCGHGPLPILPADTCQKNDWLPCLYTRQNQTGALQAVPETVIADRVNNGVLSEMRPWLSIIPENEIKQVSGHCNY